METKQKVPGKLSKLQKRVRGVPLGSGALKKASSAIEKRRRKQRAALKEMGF